MSSLVLTNAYIILGDSELSTYGNQVSLNFDVETADVTTFGDTTRANIAGLKSWSAEINFVQDFADNLLDEILWGLFDAAAAITCAFRPVNTTIGAGNPEYSGSGIITSYKPLGNSIGEAAGASVSIVSAGAMTRDITP